MASSTSDRSELSRAARLMREILAREHEARRSFATFDRGLPRNGALDRVARTPNVVARDQAQARQMLDRLMRRTVFAQADRIVRVDVDRLCRDQRRHAHRVACVVGEHEERRIVRDESTVQRETVADRAHAEFAHAVVDVVRGRIGGIDVLRALPDREIRAGEIRRTADELRQQRSERVERHLRRLARGHVRRVGLQLRHVGARLRGEIGRQLRRHAALEFRRELGMYTFILCEQGVPRGLARGAFGAGIPAGVDVARHLERRMGPAELYACGGDLVLAERGAVAGFLALLGRGAVADDGLAADQRRLVRIERRRDECRLHGLGIVAVDIAQDFPAVGFEALRGIVGEPAVDFAVDRDAVVVVEHDELAELQRARERGRFVGNAFHEAAVADEHVGVVIDEREIRPIEPRREHLLRERHANRVREPLAERAGRGFDARKFARLRMSGRLRMELAETLELVDRQVVAAQV